MHTHLAFDRLRRPSPPEPSDTDAFDTVQIAWFPRPVPGWTGPATSIDHRGRPDLLVITAPDGLALMRRELPPAILGIAPVADLSGRRLDIADWFSDQPAPQRLAEARNALTPLIERWRQLPIGVERLSDPRAILLARLSVRESAFTPVRDIGDPRLWRFAAETLIGPAGAAASALAEAGLVSRRLIDRVQACPSCASARVSVREECPGCRSPDLSEVAILHHLRCGHQAPETDFAMVEGLPRCPKCRGRLEHFSVDYDKPGHLVLCGACGRSDGAAAIGFTCLDCGGHHDAEQMARRDVHAYALTLEGRRLAFDAALLRPGAVAPADGAAARLARAFREAEARDQTLHLLMLQVALPAGVPDPGPRLREQSWSHLGALLREVFSGVVDASRHGDTFLIVIEGVSGASLRAALPEAKARLSATLRLPFDLRFDLMNKADVASVLA